MTAGHGYSGLERLLHRLAFSGLNAQTALADIEQQVFGREFRDIAIEQPVFITALPRAGTTLLLEALSGLPDFAAHTYRDMPFVLCPMLWEKISGPFRKAGSLRDRAHGDGVAIGFESPEAFEEVAWKAHWPDHYREDRIVPWTARERDDAFEAFLEDHMRKIIALRGRGTADAAPPRYVSKNNANIARLDLLSAIFPDCRILIPVRNPWDHAASLLSQHKRFSEIHAEDDFARQYMSWIGHYEFGAALKPIDFDGWLDAAADRDPMQPAFWLWYWQAAYGALMTADIPGLSFIDYDALCEEPAPILGRLRHALNIGDDGAFHHRFTGLRPSSRHELKADDIDNPDLRRSVEGLYERLRARCL